VGQFRSGISGVLKPDPARRDVRRSVIEHGVKAPEFANALIVMLSFMDAINESLNGETGSLERRRTLHPLK
jgi:hypothetical protein